MREKRRTYRLIAAFVSAAAAVVAFAALGGVGLAQTAIALVQYQYGLGAQVQNGEKVTICHKDKNTITVSVNALPAHLLNHGDTVGPCQVVLQTEVTSEQTATKTKKAKKKDAGSEAAVESEQASTDKGKKQKRRTADATSTAQTTGKPKKSKPAMGRTSGPSVESDTSTQSSVAPTSSPKPKKQKPSKSKKAAPDTSSDPAVAASPPGHGVGKGNGNGGGNGNGRGNRSENGKGKGRP